MFVKGGETALLNEKVANSSVSKLNITAENTEFFTTIMKTKRTQNTHSSKETNDLIVILTVDAPRT